MLSLRSDFLILFPNCTGSSLYCIPQILKGNAQNTSVHSAIWKFFLVVAPAVRDRFAKSDDWVRILREKRKEFYDLKARYFLGPPDDDESDPLAAGDRQDPRWNQYFSDNSLRATIARDTTRTFQELEYFQSAEVQQTLEDILFLYCRTHPHQEYAQGWHELAGFILYTFHTEMIADGSDIISFIFNAASVIPDAYFTFAALADSLEKLYEASTDGDSYCAQLAVEIQNTLLFQQSANLGQALSQARVAPQSYMVQWLRLLFVRTFEMNDAKDVWDVIVGHLPSYTVIKNICLAMLLRWERELLAEDPTGVLHFLFRFPRTVPGMEYARKAVELSSSKNSSKPDLSLLVAERLNELARGLETVCLGVNGTDAMIPYIMDLRRVRDVLMGTLEADEMLPLEQAIEIFKTGAVDAEIAKVEVEEKIEKPVEALPKAGGGAGQSTGGLFDESGEAPRKKRKKGLFS